MKKFLRPFFKNKRFLNTNKVYDRSVVEAITLCSLGQLDELKHLVKTTNVNLGKTDYDLRSPLHLAVEEGHYEVVKYLLEQGVDVNPTDRWDCTPYQIAIEKNYLKIASLLQDNGGKSKQDMVCTISLHNTIARIRSLFESLKNEDEEFITREKFEQYLKSKGINPSRARIMKEMDDLLNGNKNIDWKIFMGMGTTKENSMLKKVVTETLVVNEWNSFEIHAKEVYESLKSNTTGKVADYIPELAKYDPMLFGASIVTIDGQEIHLGNFDSSFSLQSCSKPLCYSFAIQDHGYDYIHQFVGVEPSGVAFNAFQLNSENKPHNASINSGAITVASLFHQDLRIAQKFKIIHEKIQKMAGNQKLGFDQNVYLSEKETGFTNMALAYFMASKGSFPDIKRIDDALDFYFQLCSIEINAQKLATVATTYANNGVNPFTKEKILSGDTVRRTNQLMFSTGMYDYSGEWACTIGLPAKSGVSGSVFIVVPGICGIAVYSPPLDSHGNSVRAVEFAKKLVEKYQWSLFERV